VIGANCTNSAVGCCWNDVIVTLSKEFREGRCVAVASVVIRASQIRQIAADFGISGVGISRTGGVRLMLRTVRARPHGLNACAGHRNSFMGSSSTGGR
jgi:hypothetical protein